MYKILIALILFSACSSRPTLTSNNASQQVDSLLMHYNRWVNQHPDSASLLVEQVVAISEQSQYSRGMILGYALQGMSANMKGAYELALNRSEQALTLAQQIRDDSLAAMALTIAGLSRWHKGEHSDALQYHFRALAIRENLKHPKDIANSYANIGMVYQYQGKLDEASDWVTKAIAVYERDAPSVNYAKIVHALANISGMRGHYDSALALDNKGLAICDAIQAPFLKTSFYANMANCYLELKEFDKALDYFHKSLKIDTLLDNKRQAAASYLNIGSLYLQLKQFGEAYTALYQSINLSKETGSYYGVFHGYDKLAETFSVDGNFHQAYDALKEAMRAKDSFINVASEQRIAELQTLYENGKKEQKIQEQAFVIKMRDYAIASITVGSILAGLLAFSYYKRRKLQEQKRHQQRLAQAERRRTEDVLLAEENERRRVALELHDGLGQMMTAARMNLCSFQEDAKNYTDTSNGLLQKSLHLIAESCEELRNISHNLMPNYLAQRGLINALQLFISNFSQLKIRLYAQWEEGKLDTHKEAILYRIIQEAVNNVLKHAQASHVEINIANEQDVTCTIEDNGIGFDVGVAMRQNGIGLKNIMTRVAFLNGTAEWDSQTGKGTVLSIHIPLIN
jgi:two-component system NarL family sensor kinase